MVQCRLLHGFTTRTFYNYQITRAVRVILKLYGQIDVENLLIGTKQEGNPRADDMRAAATKLEDVLIHGAILADEVGLGKTQQSLLVALLHRFLNDTEKENKASQVLFKPILLVVPPTLINQWLQEIRSHWTGFRVFVLYGGHDFKEAMALSTISHTAIKEYLSLEALPKESRYIFDTSDPRAAEVIVLTLYDTHKPRTGTKKIEKIPGVPFVPPVRDAKGRMIWKKKPREQPYWETNQKNVYSLLIADEAQKIKNYSSGSWSVLFLQSFQKTLLVTATPMYNSAKVGLLFILLASTFLYAYS
jgi:SNF2 family DNA or RNA helicase